MTFEITQDRLQELRGIISSWLSKQTASLRQVQSLAEKLNFVCSTVRSGRVFVARILNFLCDFQGGPGNRKITEGIKGDLKWWAKFLDEFNGVTMFPELRWLPPDSVISTDSCLTGCGGWSMSDREGHGHKAVLYKSQFPPLRHSFRQRHRCIHRLINHVYTKRLSSFLFIAP